MNNNIEEIMKASQTAFIDSTMNSNLAYRPQLVSNDYKEGRKVLSLIENELSKCEEFYFSVAFITMSGLEPLLQILKELEQKGIKGKILTTDYLTFSEPKAISKLAELTNVEVRMYLTNGAREGFHTKGYMFKRDNTYSFIVGSSNMTIKALTVNKEWNTKIVSTKKGEYAEKIITEFYQLWDSKLTENFADFIEPYSRRYEIAKEQKKRVKQEEIPAIEEYKLEPNSMQVNFVQNLRKLIEKGESKALLISATG